MSQEQLKAFMEKVKEDKGLQEKLAALPKDDMKAAAELGIRIAVEAGFDVKADDFSYNGQMLTDEELDNVAGGNGGCILGSFRYTKLVPNGDC